MARFVYFLLWNNGSDLSFFHFWYLLEIYWFAWSNIKHSRIQLIMNNLMVWHRGEKNRIFNILIIVYEQLNIVLSSVNNILFKYKVHRDTTDTQYIWKGYRNKSKTFWICFPEKKVKPVSANPSQWQTSGTNIPIKSSFKPNICLLKIIEGLILSNEGLSSHVKHLNT